MSGSPKYSEIRLQQQRQREIERERKRRETEEIARRKAAEEAERRRQLEAARQEARRAFEEVVVDVREWQADAASRFSEPARFAAWAARLEQAKAGADGATDEGRLQLARAEVGRIRREIAVSRNDAEVLAASARTVSTSLDELRRGWAALAERAGGDAVRRVAVSREFDRADTELNRATTEDELLAVDTLLRRLRTELNLGEQTATAAEGIAALRRQLARNSGEGAAFDPRGRREAEALLDSTEKSVKLRRPDAAQSQMARARARVEEHLEAVESERAKKSEVAEAAHAILRTAVARLTGLGADEVVGRWAGGELRDLNRRLEPMAGRIAADGADSVAREAAEVLAEADRLVARAQADQLEEDRRQYIVSSLVRVMERFNFEVSVASVGPGAEVVIRATDEHGGEIDVSVPSDGAIRYEVGGYPLRELLDGDGNPVRTCDEAEETIERIHEFLAEQYQVEAGELYWDGKPSDGSAARHWTNADARARNRTQREGP